MVFPLTSMLRGITVHVPEQPGSTQAPLDGDSKGKINVAEQPGSTQAPSDGDSKDKIDVADAAAAPVPDPGASLTPWSAWLAQQQLLQVSGRLSLWCCASCVMCRAYPC